VITGASRGIGKQLAIDFAANGYDVACLARSAKGAEGKLPGTIDETADAVREAGGKALPISVDVRSDEQVEEAAKQVYSEFGRCDVMINNAAVGIPGRTLDVSNKNWRLGVDINVNGSFYMTSSFGRRMRDAGEGRIINISTMVAWAPEFGRINYMVTKRALEALTEGAAYDLRGQVAVNCIRLELMVWTEGFTATLGDVSREGFEHPVIMSDAALWISRQPLDYTGHIVTIADLRELGVVREVTSA
jgi:NAD(P)-dependent dehydrogenase (short-subunit alcohol dehydrogenase family)